MAKCFNKGTYTNSMKSVKTIQLTQLTVEGVIVKMLIGLKRHDQKVKVR